MSKQLKIGNDYGTIFGLKAEKGQKLVYLGGISFKATQGEKELVKESQSTFDKITQYINQPVVKTGTMF